MPRPHIGWERHSLYTLSERQRAIYQARESTPDATWREIALGVPGSSDPGNACKTYHLVCHLLRTPYAPRKRGRKAGSPMPPALQAARLEAHRAAEARKEPTRKKIYLLRKQWEEWPEAWKHVEPRLEAIEINLERYPYLSGKNARDLALIWALSTRDGKGGKKCPGNSRQTRTMREAGSG